ncbi:dihydrolipoamide acetyltransferase family protein [Streptomyces sp. NBC_00059]|uniref:dihydrolipoamide acetyltransferase family protein n=1 Tax=Streptomyces sp. NBC_00059 TaxID=2975635 RepID=UPI00225318D4|nr:dihydrolipoamide acetyltransferase family protein [Streptomyces sp. NBC_00059]MCX5411463.1 2-oxo acid dehydrogenase subunit E2 [Streptomyces sp. NBC_00059]
MAQVLEFKLPDLGEGLTEAEIVRWLVEVGDVVAIDQPVVEVETAKAMVEVPCPYGGVVTARFGEEGAELPVGAPLLTVAVGSASAGSASAGPVEPATAHASSRGPSGTGARSDPGTGSDSGTGARSGSDPGTGSGAGDESGTSGNVLVGYGTGAPAARRRRVRPASTLSPAASPAMASVAAPVAGAVRAPGPVAVISPLVRKLARRHGLDLQQIAGTGRDGLILRTDVESAIRVTEEERTGGAVQDRQVPDTADERIPLRGVRGAVAEKLARSRREIPEATCWVDADATELMAARAAMNGTDGTAAGPKVSVLALLARICTAALARFPELNSRVDSEAREIVRLSGVHLGFAAQTDRGLVVPVVRDAHTRNTESIGAEIARLTEAARDGRLTPAQLTGGTFTLNNYGVFGVDGSTPIINHPEAAMLGVGRIVPKPWVHEGELAVRQVVQLSLTFDHRVCDGGTAGGFLRYVADCVEQPAVLLRTL